MISLMNQSNMIVDKWDNQVIGQYQKISLEGQGNYGQVFMAKHKCTGKIVAIKRVQKIVDEEQGIAVSLLRQISILKSLNHPNIVKLQQCCLKSSQHHAYLILQYIPSNLQKLLLTTKPIPHKKTKKLIHQVLSAVTYCHKNGIVHRDIKPSNILLDIDDTVKLGDFGIAKPVLQNPRSNTSKVASLFYRAPESLLYDRKSTFSIDVWAVGCVFLESVLGRNVFSSELETEVGQVLRISEVLQAKWKSPLENTKVEDRFELLTGIGQSPLQQKIKQLNQLLSQSGQDLLNKMLRMDPKTRITAEQALNHKFFTASEIEEIRHSQMDSSIPIMKS